MLRGGYFSLIVWLLFAFWFGLYVVWVLLCGWEFVLGFSGF